MRQVVVVAAGGFGREVAAYARDAGLVVSGFLHDLDAYPIDVEPLPAPVLGPLDLDVGLPLVLGLGDVGPRRKVADRLRASRRTLRSVVHPTAWIAPTARLGRGVLVAPFAFVGPEAVLGDDVIVNVGAVVGHDAVVGQGSAISPRAAVNGRAVVGAGCLVGAGAIVAPRVVLGDGAQLSAGSVALRDVPAGQLALGNPAKARPLPLVEVA